MTPKTKWLSLTLALTVTAPLAFSQTTATLVGDVLDPSGNAMPNASVTITSEGTGYTRTVETSDVGQYRITPLNPGIYSVSVKAQGSRIRSAMASSSP